MKGGDEDEDEEEDLDIDLPPPPPKIQTYKQAIESLEDIMIFLEQHGQIELASIGSYIPPPWTGNPTCSYPMPNNTQPFLWLTLSTLYSSVLIFRNVNNKVN